MSGSNILLTTKKTYPSSDIVNPSSRRLCGLVKDITHCENLLKKANEEFLSSAEAVYGRSLPCNEYVSTM